jgi:hypothetical protein
LGDDLIRRHPQAGVPGEFRHVTEFLDGRDRRARQVRVQKKSHGRSGSGQRVKGLFGREVRSKLQGGADIVDGEVVLALDVLERHAAGKAPNHDGNRNPSAPDDRFAVQHGGIDDDAAPNVHGIAIIALSSARLSGPGSQVANLGFFPYNSIVYRTKIVVGD